MSKWIGLIANIFTKNENDFEKINKIEGLVIKQLGASSHRAKFVHDVTPKDFVNMRNNSKKMKAKAESARLQANMQ